MIRYIYVTIVFLALSAKLLAQQGDSCYVKIGGNFYFNCKHIISFSDKDIFTFNDYGANAIRINLDVFSPSGIKQIVIQNGMIKEGNADDFQLKISNEEFTLIEKATNRIICHIQKVFNQSYNRCEFHVSADLYMPDGFYFQCTPETTNHTMLNLMKGATFINNHSAIRL